eukprot:6175584-Pleurochrysis_carterae.AAC.2
MRAEAHARKETSKNALSTCTPKLVKLPWLACLPACLVGDAKHARCTSLPPLLPPSGVPKVFRVFRVLRVSRVSRVSLLEAWEEVNLLETLLETRFTSETTAGSGQPPGGGSEAVVPTAFADSLREGL